MKLRPFLAVIAMIAITPAAHAQLGTATLISAKGDISQVATTDVVRLHDFLKKGVTLDVKAFAGFGFSEGKLTGGLALSHRVPVARELFADVGLYGRFREGRASDGGLFVALGWRF